MEVVALDVLAEQTRDPLQRLRLPLYELNLQCDRESELCLSALQVADSLRLLLRDLPVLSLSHLPDLGAEWAMVTACMPFLRKLTLWRCHVSEYALAAVAGQASLTMLHVEVCTGLTLQAWLGLAATRKHALEVRVQPAMDAADTDKCCALSRAAFEGPHAKLTFVCGVPLAHCRRR